VQQLRTQQRLHRLGPLEAPDQHRDEERQRHGHPGDVVEHGEVDGGIQLSNEVHGVERVSCSQRQGGDDDRDQLTEVVPGFVELEVAVPA
jgi:hypothetical protein